jgi:hypothetical protein
MGRPVTHDRARLHGGKANGGDLERRLLEVVPVHCPETAVADVGRGRMPGGGRFRAGGRLLGTCGRRRAAAWQRRWDAVRADWSRCGLADE